MKTTMNAEYKYILFALNPLTSNEVCVLMHDASH